MSRLEEKDKAGVSKEDFKTATDIATDSIPGVSETKDIISLGTNVGKGDYIGAGIDVTSLTLGAVPILGDAARQGFKRITKKLRDKDINDAKILIDDDKAAEKWKNSNKLAEQQRQKRNPKIQKEVDKLSEGLTTSKKYRDVVKAEQPIKPITKDNFPEMPTKTDIVGALKATDPRKIKTGIVGINKKISDGTRVGSRLDIPSYDNYDKWIVSLHDGTKKGGNAIGYGQTALLKNVEFISSAKGGLNIAKGKPKATIARIHGDYYNAEPELVYESAKKLIDSSEWTQVGMNPFKHSYFYNKATGMPVTRADEVIQVGPLVLAKGVKKPTISELKELKVKTKDGKIRMFNEGGTVMKKQMEMFEDGGLKDEGGMIDEVSGNDVPPGSTREEVRDDIPAQLSEGEFVFPADVVRFIGLEKLMQLRQEAKQGLKQMEAMGQMGNSDEATMPDDLPFDETDLDMEDELEYNRGGVVEAANGTYVAPTIPTGSQPLGTNPMGNPMGVPQQVADGVSGSTQGTPYVPNVGKMYGAGATPYAPVSYNQLLGPSATGAPTTETVRYFNAATGQSRMIPHLVNADGTRGATLYPVPEGFVIQEEAPKEEAKKTQVQSTKVAPVDTGDGGPSDDGGGAVDPAGDPLSYGNPFSLDALGKNMAAFSKAQLATITNLGVNIGKGVLGKTNTNNVTVGAITGMYTAAKNKLGLMGKNINNMTTKERNDLNKSFERAKTTVISLTTDSNGNTMSQQDTIDQVNDLADLYGVDKVNQKNNVNLDVQIGKTMADINNAREKTKDRIRELGLEDVQQGFDPEDTLGMESLSASQQQGIQDALSGKTAPSLSPSVGTGPSTSTGAVGSSGFGTVSVESPGDNSNNDGGSGSGSGASGSGSDSGPGGGVGGDATGGYTAKGGLMDKKKIVIHKGYPNKKKRGGLASR